MQFFIDLSNVKFDKLDSDIVVGFLQRTMVLSLGAEPTKEEIATALRSMTNAKALKRNELPVELLNLGLRHDPTVLRELHWMVEMTWRK